MNATQEYLEKKLVEACAKEYYAEIEQRILDALVRYAVHHVSTGAFLAAVLRNDLREAVGRADPASLAALQKIVTFVYMELPGLSWGTPEKVGAWLKAREPEDDDEVDHGGYIDCDPPKVWAKGELP